MFIVLSLHSMDNPKPVFEQKVVDNVPHSMNNPKPVFELKVVHNESNFDCLSTNVPNPFSQCPATCTTGDMLIWSGLGTQVFGLLLVCFHVLL